MQGEPHHDPHLLDSASDPLCAQQGAPREKVECLLSQEICCVISPEYTLIAKYICSVAVSCECSRATYVMSYIPLPIPASYATSLLLRKRSLRQQRLKCCLKRASAAVTVQRYLVGGLAYRPATAGSHAHGCTSSIRSRAVWTGKNWGLR
jgi:hypothetical protein